MKAISIKSLFIFLLFLLLTSSCKKDGNPLSVDDTNQNGGANITTGSSVSVTSQSIGSTGGTIKVVLPGSPVNGLEITVPQNAFPSTRTFSISYATVQSHNFGSNFKPVSPLITIKNEGGYSSAPMTIKIPIKKASDEFATAFIYNELTGKLEAVPVLSENDSTISVSVSHFEASSISLGKKLYAGQKDPSAQGNLIISSVKESILNGQTIITSGFSPGVDDWEFINYGSYIEPGGHCAGQSMTAMWYYYEKKLKGETPLFHKFDTFCDLSNPNKLWQDNPFGFRFASTIQADFNWGDWITKVNIESYFPSVVWKTFIAAMLITGEPQFVILKKSNTSIGHAMIVYKINLSENKLYIADPNFPNNRTANGATSIRTINYVNGNFEPYPSSLNAASSPVIFDQIAFFGKTANIDWSKITSRWSEVQNKTVGNDRFPQYDLYHKGTAQTVITDGMVFEYDTLKVQCRSTAATYYMTGTNYLQTVNIFDVNGNMLAQTHNSGKNIGTALYVLKPGKNVLGFYIMCPNISDGVADWYFVDFKWVTINKLGITSIDPSHGTEGATVAITGTGFKSSQGSGYVQFNGIATATVDSWCDTLITVRVPQNATSGKITVVVDGKVSNGIDFTVDAAANLNGLDQTTRIQIGVEGTTVIGTQTNITSVQIANTNSFSNSSEPVYPECPLVWNGTSFKIQGVHVRSTYQRDSVYISGTVSADGRTILSVNAAYRYYAISATDGSLTEEEKYSFTLTNVPAYVFISGNFSFLTMNSPSSKISNFSWSRWIKGNNVETGSFTSVLYIHVDFN
jgi:hypothetical protein